MSVQRNILLRQNLHSEVAFLCYQGKEEVCNTSCCSENDIRESIRSYKPLNLSNWGLCRDPRFAVKAVKVLNVSVLVYVSASKHLQWTEYSPVQVTLPHQMTIE